MCLQQLNFLYTLHFSLLSCWPSIEHSSFVEDCSMVTDMQSTLTCLSFIYSEQFCIICNFCKLMLLLCLDHSVLSGNRNSVTHAPILNGHVPYEPELASCCFDFLPPLVPNRAFRGNDAGFYRPDALSPSQQCQSSEGNSGTEN